MIKFNIEKCKAYFQEGMVDKVLQYVNSCGLKNDQYEEFLINNEYGFLDENQMIINNEEYSVECFLGVSNNEAYDMVRANKLAELYNTKYCAIAILYGGDLVCLNTEDNKVYCWFHENWDKKPICIANSFNQFVDSITHKN